eukprot:Hpha_TRINITY_DN35460_c0_g1::TRINITY_DN35460_c0_g1_i1::g.83408::m.83408
MRGRRSRWAETRRLDTPGDSSSRGFDSVVCDAGGDSLPVWTNDPRGTSALVKAANARARKRPSPFPTPRQRPSYDDVVESQQSPVSRVVSDRRIETRGGVEMSLEHLAQESAQLRSRLRLEDPPRPCKEEVEVEKRKAPEGVLRLHGDFRDLRRVPMRDLVLERIASVASDANSWFSFQVHCDGVRRQVRARHGTDFVERNCSIPQRTPRPPKGAEVRRRQQQTEAETYARIVTKQEEQGEYRSPRRVRERRWCAALTAALAAVRFEEALLDHHAYKLKVAHFSARVPTPPSTQPPPQSTKVASSASLSSYASFRDFPRALPH